MKKIITLVFVVAVIFGLIKIISIAPFDRMAADDFSYTTLAANAGLFKAQMLWYTTFTGKFINNFLVTVFGTMSSNSGSTLLYFLITFVSLFAAIWLFVGKFLNSKLGKVYPVLISLFFLVSFYFITPDKRESWYWLSGSVEYLWPITFAIAAFALGLNKKANKISSGLSFILAFFVGGGGEVAAALFLGGVSIGLIYLGIDEIINSRSKNLISVIKELMGSKLFSGLLILFAGAFISFVIMLLSPGNAIRIKSPGSDEMNILGALFYSIQKGPGMVVEIVKENFIYLLSLFVSLSAFFGLTAKPGETETRQKAIEKTLIILGIPIFMSIAYLLPGYKALGRVLPSRAEVELGFVIITSIFFAAYYFSYVLSDLKTEKRFCYDILVSFAAFTLFASSVIGFTRTLAEDVYIAKDYSTAFDRMFIQLKKEADLDKKQVIVVEKLPESGLIHSEKLNSDPGHWANKPISNFFGLEGIKIVEPKINAETN